MIDSGDALRLDMGAMTDARLKSFFGRQATSSSRRPPEGAAGNPLLHAQTAG